MAVADGSVGRPAGLDIISDDAVCLMPTKESSNHTTAKLAKVMLSDTACGIAAGR